MIVCIVSDNTGNIDNTDNQNNKDNIDTHNSMFRV